MTDSVESELIVIKKLFYWSTSLILGFMGFLLVSEASVHAAPPTNFQTTQLVGVDLSVPSGLELAPDGRLFILERTGDVRIYKNGNLLPTPFTHFDTAATGDRGLVGIAFDPSYASNHYVYFYYTGADTLNHLVRMDATPDIATTTPSVIYETNIASLELHVGGTIHFGQDGKLYLSIGDNGNASNAQDLSNPFGKIIRLNKDGTIPSDNPFVGQSGKLPEIWAYGFRNPFRFQFDPATGRLFEGDVGDYSWEEVNLVTKGLNYGWPTCEGACINSSFVNPVYAYPHNDQSSAVVGGFVYRGSMFPSNYVGQYFFGDYAQGFIKTLTLDANGNSTGVNNFDTTAGSVVDLSVAPDGSIYYVTYIPGRLYRITHSSFNQYPTAKSAVDQTQGNPGLTVNFSSTGSFDPEGTSLTYIWDFGDGTNSSQANPAKTYNSRGRYTILLTVSDGVNVAQAPPLIVQIGTPPTVNITAPVDGSLYKAGDTFSYASLGADASGSALPASAFTTNIVFHHDTHIHPFLGPVQSQSGQVTIPTLGDPSPNTSYETMITGTDADGLQTTKSVTILPQKVDLSFASNPSGMQILLDGVPTSTPVTLTHVVGFQRTLSVPALQDLNGNSYVFSSWTDGGSIIHAVRAPVASTTYIANFNSLPNFTTQFFNNTTLSGTPVLTRSDPKIDFYWSSTPYPAVHADNFSARWTNTVNFADARYRFITTSDDGVKLYIDNQLVIDKWINQSATIYYADVSLTAGPHAIKMEYFEGNGDALAKLTWDLAPTQIAPPPTPTPTPTTVPLSTPTPTPQIFSGYKGEYWNTPGATSAPTIPNTPANLVRDDPSINFNWGAGTPGASINTDHFVVRWTKPTAFDAATYRFTVTADDGVRIFIDNQIVLDKWIDQGPTTYTLDKLMTAGSHAVRVEYYENSGDAFAQFFFSKIVTTPTPIITPTPTPISQTGLTGEYFDNSNLTNFKVRRIDPTVNFNWGTGTPNAALATDTFSVRWTGLVQPQYSQIYTFYTTTDDGVRLWVNNQLLIDKWINQSAREWSGTITLTAGQKYAIKMEYYDNTWDAVAKLSWSSPSQAKQTIPQSRLSPNP